MDQANPRTRPRLLEPHSMVLVVVVSALVLYLLVPRDLMLSLENVPSRGSGLYAAYLRVLVERDPTDPRLRLRLAAHLAELGEAEEAFALLQPMLSGSERQRIGAMQVSVKVLGQLLREAPRDSLRESGLRLVLGAMLDALEGLPMDEGPLRDAAQVAALIGEYGLASAWYAELAHRTGSAELMTMAARQMDYGEQPAAAASLYRKAFLLDPGWPRLETALTAYRRAGEPAAALSLGMSHGTAFEDNPDYLSFMARVAMEVSKLEIATRFAEAYRALRDDIWVRETLLSLYLAQSRAGEALPLAEELYGPHPSLEQRRTLMGLYRYAGQRGEALQQALLILHEQPNEANMLAALAEAEAGLHFSLVADFYTLLAQQRPLSEAEMWGWYRAWQMIGNPLPATFALESYLVRYGSDPLPLRLLTQLNFELGALAQTRELWPVLEPYAAGQPETVEQVSTAFLAADEPGTALAVLASHPDWPDLENTELLERIAAVAWDLGHLPTAAASLELLLAAHGAEPEAELFNRYATLAFSRDDHPEKAAFMASAWTRTGEPGFLAEAIDLAARWEQEELLDRLLADADRNPQVYLRFPWLRALQAEHLASRGRWQAAVAAYRQGLAEQPASVELRLGLLWLLVTHGDDETLLTELERPDPGHRSDPRFAAVRGAAYMRLGQPRRAEQYYRQALAAKPDDVELRLSLLWLLVAHGDDRTLLGELRSLEADSAADPRFAEVSGAAWMRLGRPRRAAEQYRRALSGDYRLNLAFAYADALQAAGLDEAAYRVKRHLAGRLAQRLQETYRDGEEAYPTVALLQAFLSPATAQTLARAQWQNQARDREAYALWLSTLDAADAPHAMDFWYARLLARGLRPPDWQSLSMALRRNDREQVQALLATALGLPPLQRVEALRQLDHYGQALALAESELQDDQPPESRDGLRRAAADLRGRRPHALRFSLLLSDAYSLTAPGIDYYWANDRYRGQATLQRLDYDRPDLVLDAQWDAEWRYRTQLDWNSESGSLILDLDLGMGNSDPRLGIGLRASRRLGARLVVGAELGRGMPSLLNADMASLGEEDQAGLLLSYSPTRWERLDMRLGYRSLRTRLGDPLGNSLQAGVTFTESLFLADPGVDLYADWAWDSMDPGNDDLRKTRQWTGNPDLTTADFLPDRYGRVGVGARVRHGDPGTPPGLLPSPRYLLDASYGYRYFDSRADWRVSAALGSRLFGDDELAVGYTYQQSNVSGDQERRWTFSYYLNF